MSTKVIEFRISGSTNPTSAGSAIARSFFNDSAARVDLSAIGAVCVNIAVKAVAHARRFVQEKKFDLICIPTLVEEKVENGSSISKVVIQVYRTEESIHAKLSGVIGG